MSDVQRVGPVWGAAGTSAPLTCSPDSAQRVTDAHARYAAIALERRGFSLATGAAAFNVVAANVSRAALGTFAPLVGFFNPSNSNREAIITAVKMVTLSGTPGGPFYYNYRAGLTSLATSVVPAGIIRSNYLGTTPGNSAMVPLNNVVVVVDPTMTSAMTELGPVGGPTSTAVGAGVYDVFEEVAGRIIVPPGTVFGIAATAAGTTHAVNGVIWWEEIPSKDWNPG